MLEMVVGVESVAVLIVWKLTISDLSFAFLSLHKRNRIFRCYVKSVMGTRDILSHVYNLIAHAVK